MTVNYIPARIPLIDQRTGLISREWYLFFQNIMVSTGGIPDEEIGTVLPASSPDLAASLIALAAQDLGQSPPGIPAMVPLDDVLPVINSLRDEIAALRNRIDDLQKGTLVL